MVLWVSWHFISWNVLWVPALHPLGQDIFLDSCWTWHGAEVIHQTAVWSLATHRPGIMVWPQQEVVLSSIMWISNNCCIDFVWRVEWSFGKFPGTYKFSVKTKPQTRQAISKKEDDAGWASWPVSVFRNFSSHPENPSSFSEQTFPQRSFILPPFCWEQCVQLEELRA